MHACVPPQSSGPLAWSSWGSWPGQEGWGQIFVSEQVARSCLERGVTCHPSIPSFPPSVAPCLGRATLGGSGGSQTGRKWPVTSQGIGDAWASMWTCGDTRPRDTGRSTCPLGCRGGQGICRRRRSSEHKPFRDVAADRRRPSYPLDLWDGARG